MALIENIQRENLNPIEEAAAYQRLVDEFQLRQEDIAAHVGKDRATVANVSPPAEAARRSARQHCLGRALDGPRARHPRAGHREPRSAAVRATSLRADSRCARPKRWSRRKAQRAARQPTAAPAKDVHTRAAEEQLHLALGTAVTIKRKRKGGTIEIAFANEDELQRLYEYLTEQK